MEPSCNGAANPITHEVFPTCLPQPPGWTTTTSAPVQTGGPIHTSAIDLPFHPRPARSGTTTLPHKAVGDEHLLMTPFLFLASWP